MRRKLKDIGGMSLVETLCAVFVLLLLCVMVNTGLNMVLHSYHVRTATSETQLLLGSLSDALRDRLRFAVVTKQGSNYHTSIGAVSVDGAGKLTVNGQKLLADGAYGSRNYQVTAPEGSIVTYQPGSNSFDVKFSVRDSATQITQETEFTVRCLNPIREATS